MKTYDAIVVGSGSGVNIVEEALAHGRKVALVDRGPFGGTCLNLGCIPSKMLIYAADKLMEIREGGRVGVKAQVTHIDFPFIMERMRRVVGETRSHTRESVPGVKNLTFYEGEGHFVSDYTLTVKGEQITAKLIFVASGSRVFIPPIKGLDSVDYLTNETLLELKEAPKSLIIIGGGYIGVEYGHFFAAMGTRVTIVEMTERLVGVEEPEVSALLQKKLGERMSVYTKTSAEEVRKEGKEVVLAARDAGGKRTELKAEKLLVAVGRRSNADTLKVENTGVETDKRGYIKVNEYLETTRKGIYAVGDALGIQMFTHAANREALLAADNALHQSQSRMDFNTIPHAVFSYPQIGSVGLTQASAQKEHGLLVGVGSYFDTARGEAMMEKEGFAKAIVEKESGKILGFHIIGPEAPVLIQEVVNALASGGGREEIRHGIHIHPAMSELIDVTLSNLEEP